MESVPIIEAVNELSTVDVNGSAVQAARALSVSFGDDSQPFGPFQLSGSPAKELTSGPPAAAANDPKKSEGGIAPTEFDRPLFFA
jgi:hypothetical protein